MIRRRRSGRPFLVKWLDGVAGAPIKIGFSGLPIVAGMLVVLIWGAALGSSWLIKGRTAEVTVTDAVFAMIRMGSNRMAWEGAWPVEVDPQLAGPEWFWITFAAEVALLGLVFWPLWRIIGPNPGFPAVVYTTPLGSNNPRAAKRAAAEKPPESPQRVETVGAGIGSAGALPMVDTATMTAVPNIESLLVHGAPGHRLVLGSVGSNLVASPDLQPVIAFGGDRSELSDRLAGPAVNEWDGPVLVMTSRPDLVVATLGQRRGTTGSTWLFDPTRALTSAAGVTVRGPRVSHGWSPLHAITVVGADDRSLSDDERRHRQWVVARRVAKQLVNAARPEIGASVGVAEQLLAPMLLAAVGDEEPMVQVTTWANRRAVDQVAMVLDRFGVTEASTDWWGANNAEPEAVATGYRVLTNLLDPYDDGDVAGHTDGSEISIDKLLDGHVNTLYVVAPLGQSRLRPLFAALGAELLEGVLDGSARARATRPPNPLLVVLDESAAMLPPVMLEDLASRGAGHAVQLLTITPGVEEFERAMGPERATRFVTAHRGRLALSGVTEPTAVNLSTTAIGSGRPVEAADLDGDGVPHRAAAADALHWLRSLEPGEGLYVHGNLSAVRIRLRRAQERTRDQATTGAAPDSGTSPTGTGRGRRRRFERVSAPARRWAAWGGGAESIVPDIFDAEANNREAARYWEAVQQTGRLPGQPSGADEPADRSR